MKKNSIQWHSVLKNKKELAEGRVMTVSAGVKDVCLTHYKGKISAISN